MKKRIDILKNVDFLELVRIHVYPGNPTPGDRFPFRVEFEPLDKTKKIVFDDSALRRMNEILTEKASQFHPSDPRVKLYIEEFVARLARELYRNGLIDFEEIPEGPDDPYAAAKRFH